MQVDAFTIGRNARHRREALRLSDDIGETKDLAAAMPDTLKELQSKWDAWNATLVQPLWGGGKADRGGAEPGAPVKNDKRGKARNK